MDLDSPFSVQMITPHPSLKGLDPAIEAAIVTLPTPLTLEEIRKEFPAPPLMPYLEIDIPAREGITLKIRVFTPPSSEPLPILVFFHGGGWVRGSLDGHSKLASRIALCNIIVVLVEYKLSPENKFPGPIHNCVDAIRWVINNRQQIQGSKDVVFIGGDSAGGQLTIASLYYIIQEEGKLPPQVAGQVLIYPTISAHMNTSSWSIFAEGYRLNRATMEKMWDWYLSSPSDKDNPLASVNLASPSLISKLPPTLLITAEFDPLRDEGEDFSKILSTLGVQVSCGRFLSTIHGFATGNGPISLATSQEPYSNLAIKTIQRWIVKMS